MNPILAIGVDAREFVALLFLLILAGRGLVAMLRGDAAPPAAEGPDSLVVTPVTSRRDALAPRAYLPTLPCDAPAGEVNPS